MATTFSRRAIGRAVFGLAAAPLVSSLSRAAPSLTDHPISAADPHPRHRVRVLDTEIS